jgi:hypothetical protein
MPESELLGDSGKDLPPNIRTTDSLISTIIVKPPKTVPKGIIKQSIPATTKHKVRDLWFFSLFAAIINTTPSAKRAINKDSSDAIAHL